MQVTVDESLCTGHGRCYALAPDLFGPDEFGHCEVLVAGVLSPALSAQAYVGRENCPERAIAIVE